MDTLQISTSNAKTESNSRLSYKLSNPMTLNSYIALSNIDLWYNWHNITQALGNHTFTYTDNDTLFPVTLPDGSYTVKNINNFLHHTMETNGHFDSTKNKSSGNRYSINIHANATYNRITLKIGARSGISFGVGLAKMLGADANTMYNATENCPNVPQLENVTSVQVHCNLVYNEYQSDSSLLYSFSPNNSYGALLSITPRYPQWRSTRNASESIVEVWLTNQEGKLLPLEDNWGVVLQVANKELVRI